MVYIPTMMSQMPNSCSECAENRHSRFGERSTCHANESSNIAYQKKQRPFWCPLKEMEDEI